MKRVLEEYLTNSDKYGQISVCDSQTCQNRYIRIKASFCYLFWVISLILVLSTLIKTIILVYRCGLNKNNSHRLIYVNV